MIFNTIYQTDWNKITLNKQKVINKSNTVENAKRLKYDYLIDDEVLISRASQFRDLKGPFLGPCSIIQVHKNGTVRIQRGTITECINIRRLTPYTVEQEE